MDEEEVVLNGIDGDTGEPSFPPLTINQIAQFARGEALDPAHLLELQAYAHRAASATLGPIEGVDPKMLEEAGWGVIFASDADPAVQDALGELLEHRRQQATCRQERYYQVYTGDAGYHPGQS